MVTDLEYIYTNYSKYQQIVKNYQHIKFNSPVIPLLAPAWSPAVLNVPEGCTLVSTSTYTIASHQDSVVNTDLGAQERYWVRDPSWE